ncbi:MAG TPA: hypothetical protein VFX16_18275 [Pseudonocardiaceae bacterium]|nr:hypothetical protein [Pseudonocardiaceae bacterium]
MPADDISSEIVIRREAPVQGSRRPWQVLLDGQNVGLLANDGSLAFGASPGSHAVVLVVSPTLSLRSAPFEFDAVPGGRIELVTHAVRYAPVRTRVVRLTRGWTQTSAVEIAIKREVSLHLFWVQWQVLLDGQDVGRLANGGSLDLRASPGLHAVVVVVRSWAIGGIRRALFQFNAEAGGRIELVTQGANGIGVWCLARARSRSLRVVGLHVR